MPDFVRDTPESRAQQTDGAVAYSDSPVGWRTRAAGAGGTMAIFALVGFLAFFTWRVALPVAYVTFRMNRQGQLLSASIARSSGSAALDRSALDTLRRAQPLPPIPADKPDPLELSVPVEFFVRL